MHDKDGFGLYLYHMNIPWLSKWHNTWHAPMHQKKAIHHIILHVCMTKMALGCINIHMTHKMTSKLCYISWVTIQYMGQFHSTELHRWETLHCIQLETGLNLSYWNHMTIYLAFHIKKYVLNNTNVIYSKAVNLLNKVILFMSLMCFELFLIYPHKHIIPNSHLWTLNLKEHLITFCDCWESFHQVVWQTWILWF